MTVEARESARLRTDGLQDAISVDASALDSLRAIDANRLGFLARIVSLFLAEAADRVEELKAAIAAGDRPRLDRAAHTLKSSAAMVGAFRLSELCQEIQSAASPGCFVEPLVAEYDRVATILSAILTEGGGPHVPR